MGDEIRGVPNTRWQTRNLYDRISRLYDLLAGPFENRYKVMALEMVGLCPGERVLEVGSGTGWALERIAQQVGRQGRVFGLDLSSGMLRTARNRLSRNGLTPEVGLAQGDAATMPFPDGIFDAVFSSFTLELFDTSDIPIVLSEIRRVLRPEGRLVAVSISKTSTGPAIRLYEWLHSRFPRYIDCRPIYLERSLRQAGFAIAQTRPAPFLGMVAEVICGVKSANGS